MSDTDSLFNKITNKFVCSLVISILCVCFLSACGSSNQDIASVEVKAANSAARSGSLNVLIPVASGKLTAGNDVLTVDYSNASEGYIVVIYSGNSEKVKLQITGIDQITYTYNLIANSEIVLPLSSGSGDYTISLFESIGNDQFATSYNDTLSADVTNEFGPYLYPNQYVNFRADTKAVIKASELSNGASCDLDVISKVYDFVINNIVYDKEEAETVASNYLPDVDEVMATGKGICFDYAALMAAMLRSQGIPTRLEIGYAKDAYHAWISVYTKDEGWIGGVIQFDGQSWSLMDPTLAANSKSSSKIKEFIGDGSSYTLKFKY